MKLLKKLAILSMAFTLCFGAGAALTACGGNEENSSSVSSEASDNSAEQNLTAYEFTVLNADGSAATNVNVQLCVLGNGAACFMPVLTDKDGKASYNPTGFPGAGEYEIHLYDQTMTTSLEFDGTETTPTVFSKITLTLKA